MLRTSYAELGQRKTVNKRPVTVFCKWCHILGHNGVQRKFYSKNSKISLWWSAVKHFLKTVIPRRLTVFCKLVIICLVMGFNKNFKVRLPKCRFDKRHQKTRLLRRLRGVWHYLANWKWFFAKRESARFLLLILQIDVLMISKKNKLRRIIFRRLIVFCKLVIF